MTQFFKGIVSSIDQLIEALVDFDYEEALKETGQDDSIFHNEEHPHLNK